ncbi:hypothetical protein ES708_29009 [subsurface metagenome]
MEDREIDVEMGIESRSSRPLNNKYKSVLILISVLFSLMQIYQAMYYPFGSWTHKSLVLSFAGILTVMFTNPNWSNKIFSFISDFIITVGLIASSIYLAINQTNIITRVGIDPTLQDVIFGLLMILGVLEITRRAIGVAMPLVCIAFLLYPWFGKYIPGPLGHNGYDISRVISAINIVKIRTNNLKFPAIPIINMPTFVPKPVKLTIPTINPAVAHVEIIPNEDNGPFVNTSFKLFKFNLEGYFIKQEIIVATIAHKAAIVVPILNVKRQIIITKSGKDKIIPSLRTSFSLGTIVSSNTLIFVNAASISTIIKIAMKYNIAGKNDRKATSE